MPSPATPVPCFAPLTLPTPSQPNVLTFPTRFRYSLSNRVARFHDNPPPRPSLTTRGYLGPGKSDKSAAPTPNPNSVQTPGPHIPRRGVAAERGLASTPIPTPEDADPSSPNPATTELLVCSVCARYADMLLRDVPYDELPLNLRMKLHFDKHRFSSWSIIVAADLLADLSVVQIVHAVNSPLDALSVLAGALAAWALADLASGTASWFTFNFLSDGERACYCDGIADFGRRIAINCVVVLPFLGTLALRPPRSPLLYSFLVYFLSFLSVIPALVDWSGSSSFPPSVARALRRIGLILGDGAPRSVRAVLAKGRAGERNDGMRREWEGGMEEEEDGEAEARNVLQGSAALGTARQHAFLNRAWHTIMAEWRVFSMLEKWIFVSSRGRLVPMEWRLDPSARVRAFASDISELVENKEAKEEDLQGDADTACEEDERGGEAVHADLAGKEAQEALRRTTWRSPSEEREDGR